MTAAGGIGAVILAAGRSSRMGRFKPLLPLGDVTVVERVVKTFQTAAIDPIVVVTGHCAEEMARLLAPLKIRCHPNPGYRDGMFSSVRTGLNGLPDRCRAVFIHPVDIPLVRPRTVAQMAEAFDEHSPAVLYPTFDGRRGHPALVAGSLVPEILAWQGRGGLRTFLQGREAESLELPVADEAVLLDMDTAEEYRRLTARLGNEDLPTAT